MNSQESKVEERVTYVDLSQCIVAEEDELPDILSDEFPGAQVNENDCITPLFTVNIKVGKEDEFIGTLFTGAQDVEGTPFTGAFKVTDAQFTGAQDVAGTPIAGTYEVTGAQFTGALFQMNNDFTGAQEKDVPTRVQEARRRLSLSLKKSKTPENFSQPNMVKKLSDIEFVDLILIESLDSSHGSDVEYYEPDDNPGTGPAEYIFIPIGTGTRHCLAPLFGINRMGPLPNYSGIMKVCNGIV